jgi:hypothetical protein
MPVKFDAILWGVWWNTCWNMQTRDPYGDNIMDDSSLKSCILDVRVMYGF